MIRRPPRSTPLSLHDALPICRRADSTGEEAMAEFTVNPQRLDPYKNFKFRVKWDGRYVAGIDRKSTRLNSSHTVISYAVFCLKKKKKKNRNNNNKQKKSYEKE